MAEHTLRLSDLEISILERSLRAYHVIMGIQIANDTRHEADKIAHVSSLVQAHLHCDCVGLPARLPEPKHRNMPIENRRVV